MYILPPLTSSASHLTSASLSVLGWGGRGVGVNVQIVSYLELLRLQGHGVISPLSPRHGAANLLYSAGKEINCYRVAEQ